MGEPRDSSTWWSELPEDMQTEVLAELPWECLTTYGGVCRDWNALFSSTHFITEQWANKKPWLVMCHRWGRLGCMAYCFSTNTWKTISLSFLKEKYPFDFAWFHRSAAGLFLLTIDYSEQVNAVYSWIVCNPLTGTSFTLPAINDSTTLSIGIMGGEAGHSQAKYKVVAVVESENTQRVEIYDSSSKSWRTAGYLPQNWEATTSKLRTRMVFCEDVLYCLANSLNPEMMGIISFSIQNGNCNFTQLPRMEVVNYARLDHLLSCGSRILIATCITDVSGILEDIIIWEFHQEERSFHQIAKMPRENFRGKNYWIISFDFQGIEDLICIKYGDSLEVFVYNLKEKSWSKLPACPIDDGIGDPPATTIFAFEPRPEMKVD